MDPLKLSTLKLIVACSVSLSIPDKGNQLVQVAWDYLEEGYTEQARDVLTKIEPVYFTDHLPRQLESKSFSGQVAQLIDTFGIDLGNLQPKGSS